MPCTESCKIETNCRQPRPCSCLSVLSFGNEDIASYPSFPLKTARQVQRSLLLFSIFKGTGSPDGLGFSWHIWIDLGQKKVRGWSEKIFYGLLPLFIKILVFLAVNAILSWCIACIRLYWIGPCPVQQRWRSRAQTQHEGRSRVFYF